MSQLTIPSIPTPSPISLTPSSTFYNPPRSAPSHSVPWHEKSSLTLSICFSYVEGRGLYAIGGYSQNGTWAPHIQTFFLDFSVSWNTSNPVFKKLPNGPVVATAACTMFNNGEDLLVVTKGTGYTYNVRSNSWSYLHNNNFMDISWMTMATDPESGITYIINGAMDYYWKRSGSCARCENWEIQHIHVAILKRERIFDGLVRTSTKLSRYP
jgi:hypothetical protein